MSTKLTPTTEGTTHINAHPSSTLELGRFLSRPARAAFKHPRLGWFESLTGLHFYLLVHPEKNEALRKVWGSLAIKVGTKLLERHPREHKGAFERNLIQGLEAKLFQHPTQLRELARIPRNVAIVSIAPEMSRHPAQPDWLIREIERMRLVGAEHHAL